MIGIDIVSIGRFEKFLEKKNALNKYLNKEEIALVSSSTHTAAGFFAAKEAISKALGTGIGATCAFHDIHLHKDVKGAPYFTLPKTLITQFHIQETSLSISHDGGFAIAVATIQGEKSHKSPLSHN